MSTTVTAPRAPKAALSVTAALQWRKQQAARRTVRTTEDRAKYSPYFALAEELHFRKAWTVLDIARFIQSSEPALQAAKDATAHQRLLNNLNRGLAAHLATERQSRQGGVEAAAQR